MLRALVATGLGLSVGASSAAASVTDGLVAWWRMELRQGNWIPDASGHDHTLTVQGSPTFDGSVVVFNDDGTLQAEDSDELDLLNDWTVSFWVREDSHDHSPNDNPTNGWIQKVRAYHGEDGGWYLVSDANYMSAVIYGVPTCPHHTEDTVPLSSWMRITVTFDSDSHTLRLYWNSSLVGEFIDTCSNQANSYPVVLGGYLDQDGETAVPYFKGALADVRIYNRILSDQGIEELFEMGLPQPSPCHPADLNGDGVVNAADLAVLLGAWGPCPQ